MDTIIVGCDLDADDVFGPVVAGCRDDFDFTLLFEQALFSTLPAAVTTIAAVASLFRRWKQSVKTAPGTSWRPYMTISLVKLSVKILCGALADISPTDYVSILFRYTHSLGCSMDTAIQQTYKAFRCVIGPDARSRSNLLSAVSCSP